jgi:ABC-type sugar transport systems, permease components
MLQKSKPYLLVLPAVTIIVVLLFGGIAEGLVQSLGYFPANGRTGFSFTAYRQLFSNNDFIRSFEVTVRISVISTLFASILGVMVAVCLFMVAGKQPIRGNQTLYRIFQIPLLLPHLVAAYLVILLLMQSGWLSRILLALGFTKGMNSFPVLTNDPSGWGIILTYTWKEAPFITLMIYPVLMRIRSSWLEAARIFGANSWQSFREILLPLLFPALASSAFIVFAFTFSAFEVPYMIGVTYPPMLPVLSFNLYTGDALAARPEALAINIILSVMTAVSGGAAYLLTRRFAIQEGGRWS